jgi:TetR/AcrR family transcriptional regulator, cholesterol catabolism regulator
VARREQVVIRDDIVQAATRIFSRRGYHGTSMQHIAEELGMRKASLYHHVSAKEDLLFAIHQRLIDKLVNGTLEVVSSSLGPEEKLRRIILVNTQMVTGDVDAVSVFLKERDAIAGERWAGVVAQRDVYEQMVAGVIRDGVNSGVFVQADPALLTKAVLSMPSWASMWFRAEGPMNAEQLAELFSDVALYGIVGRR